MTPLEYIKGFELFHELYDDEIEKILVNSTVLKYNKDEFIGKAGEVGSHFYIILSGSVKIIDEVAGQSIDVEFLDSGNIFGEMILVNEIKYKHSFMATEKCDVLAIKQSYIYSLFNNNTKVFAIVSLNLTRLLTKRIARLTHVA